MKDIDEIFSFYLNTLEVDKIYDDFNSAIRKAFIAGYKAAGGELPKEQPVIRLISGGKTKT